MPTYKNNTKEQIAIGKDEVIPAGGMIEKLSYLSKQIEGIEKISDKPMYNSVIFSSRYTQSSVIDVPMYVTRYTIHIYVEKGEAQVFWNSEENLPCLNLYEGAKWNTRCYERLIDKIIIKPGECGRVWVSIEIL